MCLEHSSTLLVLRYSSTFNRVHLFIYFIGTRVRARPPQKRLVFLQNGRSRCYAVPFSVLGWYSSCRIISAFPRRNSLYILWPTVAASVWAGWPQRQRARRNESCAKRTTKNAAGYRLETLPDTPLGAAVMLACSFFARVLAFRSAPCVALSSAAGGVRGRLCGPKKT